MSTATQQRPLLTIPDAAQRTKLSEKTIRRLIARGELPALRVGASIRLDPVEFERWLRS